MTKGVNSATAIAMLATTKDLILNSLQAQIQKQLNVKLWKEAYQESAYFGLKP